MSQWASLRDISQNTADFGDNCLKFIHTVSDNNAAHVKTHKFWQWFDVVFACPVNVFKKMAISSDSNFYMLRVNAISAFYWIGHSFSRPRCWYDWLICNVVTCLLFADKEICIYVMIQIRWNHMAVWLWVARLGVLSAVILYVLFVEWIHKIVYVSLCKLMIWLLKWILY